jgi:hypothetical protein
MTSDRRDAWTPGPSPSLLDIVISGEVLAQDSDEELAAKLLKHQAYDTLFGTGHLEPSAPAV